MIDRIEDVLDVAISQLPERVGPTFFSVVSPQDSADFFRPLAYSLYEVLNHVFKPLETVLRFTPAREEKAVRSALAGVSPRAWSLITRIMNLTGKEFARVIARYDERVVNKQMVLRVLLDIGDIKFEHFLRHGCSDKVVPDFCRM